MVKYSLYIFGRDVLFKYQFAARTYEKTLAIFFIISYTLKLSVLLTVLDDDNAMTGARSWPLKLEVLTILTPRSWRQLTKLKKHWPAFIPDAVSEGIDSRQPRVLTLLSEFWTDPNFFYSNSKCINCLHQRCLYFFYVCEIQT